MNNVKVHNIDEMNNEMVKRLSVIFPDSVFSRGEERNVTQFNFAFNSRTNVLVTRDGNAAKVIFQNEKGENIHESVMESFMIDDDLADRVDTDWVPQIKDCLDRYERDIRRNLPADPDMPGYISLIEDLRHQFLERETTGKAVVLSVYDEVINDEVISYNIVIGYSTPHLTLNRAEVERKLGHGLTLRMTSTFYVPKSPVAQ